MKTKIFLLALLFLSISMMTAQDHLGPDMPVGAYYYPEHWPEEQWERDLKKMSELGFTFTHFAEFAWSKLEPMEGDYQFEWLDKCVGLAEKYGLKVIMCTPSPTPPAWLTEKHPEILVVGEEGLNRQHGTRLQAAYNHPVYLHYVEKIVRKLGERYGNDNRIWGWQLDNEPHYASIYDYSPWQEKQFRYWLRQKYRSIDSLNHAWGAAFWSQDYNHFDQVHLPNSIKGSNPHAQVDFRRFSAEQVAEGLRFQAKLLRDLVSKKQWITTNYAYFKFLPSVDPFLSRDDLDFASHTMYLTSQFLSDAGDKLAHRLGSGLELSFSQELAQSVSGETGIMELQPGQINWGSFNPQPLPGAVRMWLWHAYALGDRFACTYRFRQPLFGSEQTHYGIMMTDGTTVQRGGEEYVQGIKELTSIKEKKGESGKEVYNARRTAFLWDPQSMLDMEAHPHHKDWDSWQFYYTWYSSLKRLGAPVDFVIASDDIDPKAHPFWLVPAAIRADKSLITKWKKYVEAGGNLVLTSRTATKDRNGHLWEAKLQEPIWDLIGAEIQYYDHLPANHPGQIIGDGEQHSWHVWGDVISVKQGTEVLASHGDQFYRGEAAATFRKLGKGTVSYMGFWSDDRELEYNLLRKVFDKSGVSVFDLPLYVFVEWRDGKWIGVNYTAEELDLPLAKGAKMLIGEKILKPGEVGVWTE